MAGRILAQLLAAGIQVGARVFAQVWQDVSKNAAKNGGAAAEGMNEGVKHARKKLANQMSVEEAYKVLDIPPTATVEEITTKYDHLFKVLEKSNGGTLYLQSKVYRAKETLNEELGIEPVAPSAPPPSTDTGATNSDKTEPPRDK